MKIFFLLVSILLCAPLRAAEDAATAAPAATTSGAGAVIQMLGALAVVLAVLFAALWLLRRLSGGKFAGGGAPIRTVGGIAVGSRERIVLLEIGEHWLVVGVAPGSVNGIATLPRGELPAAAQGASPPDFAALLARLRKGER
ncbi:flagellar biosynthetic protein FliO [Methyloversatilis thermotolerans]|uniref:flagellar biosynthetic protein FliO n=1 Tax=Methyloversatilis thermotolerans TaxID=1346290 RepID=UPI00035CE89D|nr:flagellar biosynthetic protein FliO [Methyloversatilis thermotolerans]